MLATLCARKTCIHRLPALMHMNLSAHDNIDYCYSDNSSNSNTQTGGLIVAPPDSSISLAGNTSLNQGTRWK